MEGVQSFEQRSYADYNSRCNRVIVANRHEPTLDWQAASERSGPLAPQANSETTGGYCSRLFNCCASDELDTAEKSGRTRKKRRFSETSALNNGHSSQNGATFDFGPFPSNVLKTSKYTLLNFLPKNLFEQFRRMANFYFLITAIIQIAVPFSPVGPSTSLIPLAFVISTTAIKQAYEDYLRHKLDNEVNNRICNVLRANKQLVKVRSKDIRVGDIVYVQNNEEIPCDMLLLASSGTADRCYVTTANLDGETSLKGRTCFQIHQQVGGIEKIDETMLVIECERPNATLYEFNGFLRAPKDQAAHERLMSDLQNLDEFRGLVRNNAIESSTSSSWQQKRLNIISTIYQRIKQKNWRSELNKQMTSDQLKSIGADYLVANRSEHVEIPLDISNLLLRASRLRNTSYIYGLAIYTGPDTRLAYNSQVKPNKFSSLESRVNMFLLLAFLFLVLITLISSFRYRQPDQWYLTNLQRADSFSQILMAHFLLYNYLVPISLYVTLEFVKFLGTISVLDDKKLRAVVPSTTTSLDHHQQVKSDQQKLVGPQCNSSDLNEDLGQVEVLFSDKTGTLTENKMLFMACSIGGRLFRSLNSQLYEQPEGLCYMPVMNVARKLSYVDANRYGSLSSDLAAVVSPHSASYTGGNRSSRSSSDKSARLPANERPFDHRIRPPLKDLRHFESLEKHEEVAQFFVALCLCSTITLNEQLPVKDCLPDKVNHYDYRSASPDEESLISAAAQFGVIVCKSSERECFITIKRSASGVKVPPPQKGKFKCLVETTNSNSKFLVRQFERLVTFEFNSVRKKMSVLYKDCDNESIIMFTKGSESVLDCIGIAKRPLTPAKYHETSPNSSTANQNQLEHERVIDMTLAHFEAFSKSGLRTMLAAKKWIGVKDLEKINRELHDARLLAAPENREMRLDKLYKRIESNMDLIGATAVEDSLQEGVPETIANLKEAGIKVWLLTGDKVETAVSVAYLCKLLDRNMNLLNLVRQQDSSSCKDLLVSFGAQIKKALVYGDCDEDLSSLGGSGGSLSRESAGKRPQRRQPIKTLGQAQAIKNGSGGSKTIVTNEMDMPRFALIADGRSLHYAMKHARVELEYVSTNCACVLGCRLSPLQKAEIVEMIKHGAHEPITAAIGDGANDVSMIQEAHVGIGISGKEGRQAVNSSDFSINRFHMIRRLFFVHGHLFYYRTAITIHYFFYKNLLLIVPQFLYSFYNLSSATSLYHPIMLISFNMIFTAVPILLFGLSERNMSEDLLENYPRLYKINHRNRLMHYARFMTWLLMGAIQAVITFYFIYLVWGSHTPILESGKMSGMIGFSSILYTALVVGVTLKLYLISKNPTCCFDLASILSCLSVPIVFLICSLFDLRQFFSENSLYRQFLVLAKSPTYWLAILTTTAAMIIPDVIMHVCDQIIYYRTINSMTN